MAKQRPLDILCDLCEEEPALSFCDECRHKLGDICLLAHTKQKRTKCHHVTEIENIKLSVLRVRCSSCENQAEKFCPDCNIRLCFQCAGRHHKLSGTLASREQLFYTDHSGRQTSSSETSPEQNAIDLSSDDGTVGGKPAKLAQETDEPATSHESSSILKQDSTSMPTQVHAKEIAKQHSPHIVCDLCEDEQALSFCDECQNKLGDICLLAHGKQKRTKAHHVNKIENVQLSVLKVICSFCMNPAENVCAECGICLCDKCAGNHHKLSDTLASAEPTFKLLKSTSDGQKSSSDKIQEQPLSNKDFLYQKPGQTGKERSPNSIKKTEQNSSSKNKFSDEQMSSSGATHVQLTGSQNPLDEINDQTVEGSNKPSSSDSISMCEQTSPSANLAKISSSNDQMQLAGGPDSLDQNTCQTVNAASSEISKALEQISPVEKHFSDGLKDSLGNDQVQLTCNQRPRDARSALTTSDNDQGQLTGEADSISNTRDPDVSRTSRSVLPIDSNACSSNAASVDGNELQGNIPRNPYVWKVFTDHVYLAWTGVQDFSEGDAYQVHIENPQTAKWHLQIFTINNGNIGGLDPGTSYFFKVRHVKANGDESIYSEKSEVVTTYMTFASTLVGDSIPVKTIQDVPAIYLLPMKEFQRARNETAMTKKYDIGARRDGDTKEKTIMLVGATGTGKSTLVDGIANYVLGVRFEDPFRFTVMQEEDKAKQHNQAVSQTDWITCYSFNPRPGCRLMYRLNVIDTPGFGDTRGLDRDQRIVEQIRQLFEETGERGIQAIDAVCFLVKAPDSRMTALQRYIFHAIMSLFGQDIEGNICTLITFADGSIPPVLSAVKASDLPFGKTFTFNNSALFSDASNSFSSMFWKMGLQSFDAVFNHLKTLETKSIQLTKEVLQERQRLETTCQSLQTNINAGLLTIQAIKSEIILFQQNTAEINRNENFTYETTEVEMVKVDLPAGVHVTNCLICNRTCHDRCKYADDIDKVKCSAMDFTGHCRNCPEKCYWNLHKNAPFRIDVNIVQVKKTYDDMKKKYQEAIGKMPTLQQVVSKMEEELEDLTARIEEMVDNMRKCNWDCI